MKRHIATLFLYLIIFMAVAQAQESMPKHEVRAVWLTTIGGLDWPHTYAQNNYSRQQQQAELTVTLDQLKDAGINLVLLQARIRATTIYPSRFENMDACLTGNNGGNPGYDPLQFAIDECHKRGMECHAWVVTIPIGKWNSPGCKSLRTKMPNSIIKVGQEGYMNPESQQTATYLADICEEIARRYDVDGIHLDYIRYPEEWRTKTAPETARTHISNIVKTIHQRVKAIKPWIRLSCSPIGKYKDLTRYSSRGWNAYNRVHQDAQLWLKHGWMDMLLPMMYFKGNNFFPFMIDWKENSYGHPIAAGLGIYFLSPREGNWQLQDIVREMELSRRYGVGQAFFRSKFFTDNTKGIYDFAKQKFYRYPALLPPMTTSNCAAPQTPTKVKIDKKSTTESYLSWQSDAPLFNVYFSKTTPVETDKAENLLYTRLSSRQIAIPTDYLKRYHFAVTAMNRFGQESQPAHIGDPSKINASPTMLPNNGEYIFLTDEMLQEYDRVYAIESTTGVLLSTQTIRANRLRIKDLNSGVYVVKAINRKGQTVRVGFFRK